jgi:hypothetical protein
MATACGSGSTEIGSSEQELVGEISLWVDPGMAEIGG